MTVGLIWAQSANRVIGREGTLPWSLPEDMAHFRATTAGATVVMGRHTWESLPPRFRPLPGRRNIVLTRLAQLDGAETITDISQAFASTEDVWVIGGAGVYRAAMPFAQRLVVTELADDFTGDVLAPDLDSSWSQVSCDPVRGWSDSVVGLRYRIVEYARAESR